jgi:hypothetical protein
MGEVMDLHHLKVDSNTVEERRRHQAEWPMTTRMLTSSNSSINSHLQITKILHMQEEHLLAPVQDRAAMELPHQTIELVELHPLLQAGSSTSHQLTSKMMMSTRRPSWLSGMNT